MKTVSTHPTSAAQNFFRVLLAVMLVTTGLGHLTWARTEFQAQVPNWVPMDKDLVVVLSGYVELLFAAALLFVKKFRVAIGWILALFFVAVFPGNVAQYVHHRDALGMHSDTVRGIRLFFQPVLVIWTLWCTGAWPRQEK